MAIINQYEWQQEGLTYTLRRQPSTVIPGGFDIIPPFTSSQISNFTVAVGIYPLENVGRWVKGGWCYQAVPKVQNGSVAPEGLQQISRSHVVYMNRLNVYNFPNYGLDFYKLVIIPAHWIGDIKLEIWSYKGNAPLIAPKNLSGNGNGSGNGGGDYDNADITFDGGTF